MTWQPTAHFKTVLLRARVYKEIRAFFEQRDVLEVETPILSGACVPDLNIEPFYTDYHGPNPKRLFLQTSPELAMKRLLAAGSGPIFQICKVFRDGEAGRWHHPEFSLLEWYRPGFNKEDLIEEVDVLLQTLLHCPSAERLRYCTVFEHYTGLHPLKTALSVLQAYAAQFGLSDVEEWDRDTCLELILSHQIEPHLGEILPLANGFYELTDPVEQRERFEADLRKRQAINLPTYPLDEAFLAALESGLPDCAGVALGLDRLLMLIAGVSHIDEVLALPVE